MLDGKKVGGCSPQLPRIYGPDPIEKKRAIRLQNQLLPNFTSNNTLYLNGKMDNLSRVNLESRLFLLIS